MEFTAGQNSELLLGTIKGDTSIKVNKLAKFEEGVSGSLSFWANVEIGENTIIAAQTVVDGPTKIGTNCMIGGQVGIVGHITIADWFKIAAQPGKGNSVTKENEVVQGSPAFNIGDFKHTSVIYKKLPELEKKIDEMQKTVDSLNNSLTTRL